MTARDDRQKYDYICELVDKTYPILAPVWQAARARFGAAWLREFIENIEVVYGTVDIGIEGRLGDALDGYAEFVNDSLRNQSFYEKHRRYKASSYAECVDAYYHNADHMIRCYLPGMYLSHLLWPQHYNMLCGFRENMLRRLDQPKLFFEVGVGFTSYELDLFGKIRSLNHAALEQYFASAETRRSSQLTLVAEVASAYLAILADETILKVTRETLDSQTASYDLTKKSLDAGTSTAVALRQAAQTVDTARANLAEYTRQAEQDRNALMILIGVPIPEDIVFSTDINAQTMSADLPVGVPSEVLARRPDVLAAEHQLVSANADIGAARAAFFPSITLTGNYGTASTQLSGLFKKGSSAWTFSPQISVPIFAGGANVANLDLSKIEKNVYIAQYEKALQTAFREVDDALAARGTLDDQLAAQRALLDDSSEAYRLADMRFRNGIDSFLPVLDAQRALYTAQQAVVSLELQRLQNMATLYKALGGGMKEDSGTH